MNDSILNTIKKMLGGIDESETDFDDEIIVGINYAMTILHDLGFGPAEGYSISGVENTWSEYISEPNIYEDIKSYIHLKVKLIFDPPANSTTLKAYEGMISEMEWRICNRPLNETTNQGGNQI